MSASNLLKHWQNIISILNKFFFPNVLIKNNIILDSREQITLINKFLIIKQILNGFDDYVFIKSIDYIPIRRVDIDILVLNNFDKYLKKLKKEGFRITKIDAASITMKYRNVQVDLHQMLNTPLINFYINNNISIEHFYNFNIFEPRFNVVIYLIDLLDKKVFTLGLLLNMVYGLSRSKGIDPQIYIQNFLKKYQKILLKLPANLSVSYRLHLLYEIYKILYYLSKKTSVKSPYNIIKDIIYLLK